MGDLPLKSFGFNKYLYLPLFYNFPTWVICFFFWFFALFFWKLVWAEYTITTLVCPHLQLCSNNTLNIHKTRYFENGGTGKEPFVDLMIMRKIFNSYIYGGWGRRAVLADPHALRALSLIEVDDNFCSRWICATPCQNISHVETINVLQVLNVSACEAIQSRKPVAYMHHISGNLSSSLFNRLPPNKPGYTNSSLVEKTLGWPQRVITPPVVILVAWCASVVRTEDDDCVVEDSLRLQWCSDFSDKLVHFWHNSQILPALNVISSLSNGIMYSFQFFKRPLKLSLKEISLNKISSLKNTKANYFDWISL